MVESESSRNAEHLLYKDTANFHVILHIVSSFQRFPGLGL